MRPKSTARNGCATEPRADDLNLKGASAKSRRLKRKSQAWTVTNPREGRNTEEGGVKPPLQTPDEKMLRLLSNRGNANGVDPVCAKGGGGVGVLPAARRRDIRSDARGAGVLGAEGGSEAFMR